MTTSAEPPFLPFSRPSMGAAEIDAVQEILRSGWITTGPKCRELEDRFCSDFGCTHAVSVSSATAGMHLALLALGIGPGDEVITPSLTWVSTANMITLLGAEPVFVDVDPDTLMVDAATVETAISPRTKAVVPVHYAGAPLDVDPIRRLARERNFAVVEDGAHAAGTEYAGRRVGATGTAVFSFHAIKNMTCAEGGMVVTDDAELAERVRSLRFHGLGVDAYDRKTHGRKPQAEVIEPGYKYNLADINAAIAVEQLGRLSEINARRGELAGRYLDQLEGLPLQPLRVPPYSHVHAWHLFIVRIDPDTCGIGRDECMQALAERDIGSGIHFRAVHTQKYYRHRHGALNLPHTQWNSKRLLSLPLFPDMADTDVDRVVSALGEIVE